MSMPGWRVTELYDEGTIIFRENDLERVQYFTKWCNQQQIKFLAGDVQIFVEQACRGGSVEIIKESLLFCPETNDKLNWRGMLTCARSYDNLDAAIYLISTGYITYEDILYVFNRFTFGSRQWLEFYVSKGITNKLIEQRIQLDSLYYLSFSTSQNIFVYILERGISKDLFQNIGPTETTLLSNLARFREGILCQSILVVDLLRIVADYSIL